MAKYVVVAPYVTLKTMTHQGARILGFHAGAPVPDDVPPEMIKHHLDNKLIAEVADPTQIPQDELFPTPLEQMDAAGVSAADRVAEGEKSRNRAAGAVKAAETRKANEEADAEAARAKAAEDAKAAKAADAVKGEPVTTARPPVSGKGTNPPTQRA